MGQEIRRSFLMPHGSLKKVQQIIEERKLYVKPYAEEEASKISVGLIGKVLRGDKRVTACKKLCNVIYDTALEVGGMEITHRIQYDRTGA